MGGSGSGRWYRGDKKDTTEAARRLDVRHLHQHRLLTPGRLGTLSWMQGGKICGWLHYRVDPHALILDYHCRAYDADWVPMTERIPLEHTPCHYGGSRPWFRCPRCTRRVAVLYGEGKLFLCRHCCGLTYAASRNAQLFDGSVRRERSGNNWGDQEVSTSPFLASPEACTGRPIGDYARQLKMRGSTP